MKKYKAIVLGCGMIGQAIARDLASDDDFEVAVADINPSNLHRLADAAITTHEVNLGETKALRDAIKPMDIVLGAMPSVIGFASLRTIIEAEKPFCDITFMPEDAIDLDSLAKEKGVTAVVDCGVSPGLSNLCVGYACHELDRVDNAVIYVGGLPKVPRPPFFYTAPFAPSDVIEEYTRPARLVEDGKIVTREALSEPELIDFPQAGELEAFNTDGLRSLLSTVSIPNMKEKTLRYSGHIDLMRIFRETGLFSKETIDVDGGCVRPLDVTSKLLFPMWKRQEDDIEFTVMRVVAEGERGGKLVRMTMDLYDEDQPGQATSMARTTAFPCAIVARMIARKQITATGVLPLELLTGDPGFYGSVVQELSRRSVNMACEITEVS